MQGQKAEGSDSSSSSSKESGRSAAAPAQKTPPKTLVKGPKVVEPVFEQRESLDDRIKSQIVLSLATFTDETPPTKICEALKSMLDSKFGKGWCVFAGAHFAGSCTFEEKYFAQVSFGTYAITLFRIFVPGA